MYVKINSIIRNMCDKSINFLDTPGTSDQVKDILVLDRSLYDHYAIRIYSYLCCIKR